MANNARGRRGPVVRPAGATWSPLSASISPNPRYRAPGTPGGRSFASTEHLAPEAVAAFVDGELPMTPHMRAAQHLSVCAECASAVSAQSDARARLRTSGDITVPESLLGSLTSIPTREFDIPVREARGRRTRPAAGLRRRPLDAPGFPVQSALDPQTLDPGSFVSPSGASAEQTPTRRGRWWGR